MEQTSQKSKSSKIIKKRQLYIQDFMPCERLAQIAGYTFLPKLGNIPTKLATRNGKLVQIVQVFLQVLLVISFVLCVQTEQTFIMIENVLFTGVNLVMLLKIYMIFLKNSTKIDEIIEKLDEHFPQSGPEQLILKVHKYLENLKLFEKLLFVGYNELLTQFILTPFLHQIYGWHTSIEVQLEHIFALYLWFDMYSQIVYPLIYIIEAWLVFFAVQLVACTDLLFASLVEILAMEFDILGQKISEIRIDGAEEEAIKELKKLVDIHQELIEVSEKIDEIFSLLQLSNAIGSIMTLCTACFLSVSGISGYFLTKYLSFIPILALQIFTPCYFSQRLIDSSMAVSTAAYNSEWYSGSVKFRRLILQIMVRAQKPQTVTAWRFFDMSLEIFYWIINTSYSYFSVLKGTYGS